MYAYASYGVNGKPDLNNRCLFIDGIMMSCLADERTYHESLIHPAMIASPNPKRVAVLGGGEGASLREILRYKSVEKAYMLEVREFCEEIKLGEYVPLFPVLTNAQILNASQLDDVVIDLCKRNLPTMSDGAYSSPHVDLRIGDAFDFFASPEGEEGAIFEALRHFALPALLYFEGAIFAAHLSPTTPRSSPSLRSPPR